MENKIDNSMKLYFFIFFLILFFFIILSLHCQKKEIRNPSISHQTDEIHLIAAGDTMLDIPLLNKLQIYPEDYKQLFSSLVNQKDIFIANLEAPITDYSQLKYPEKKYNYKQQKGVMDYYNELGLTHFCLANNHIFDYSTIGFFDTLNILKQNQRGFFGADQNIKETQKGTIIEIKGIKIGLVAFMDAYWIYRDDYFAGNNQSGVLKFNKKNMNSAMSYLNQQCDLIVVYCHWGSNYKEVTARQKKLARQLVKYGADIIIGHHPHIPQDIEIYRGVPIFYSLGNFFFMTSGRFVNVDKNLHYGWVLDITINESRLKSIEIIPLKIDNEVVKYMPQPINGDFTEIHFKYLIKKSINKIKILNDRAILQLN